MKRFFKFLLYVLAILFAVVILGASYSLIFLPNVGPPPDLVIEVTDERVERGNYLANHVMLCIDCHAVRDFSTFAGPIVYGTSGAGGEVFDQNMGLPGRFISRNITPAALGDWTDGEIFRAVTSGVSKDGSALFPIMPYTTYATLDEEDIYSIIAYLRTLEPIENDLPPSKPDFPVNILINTMPVKTNLTPKPDPTDPIAYGRYMTTAAACSDCHTLQRGGSVIGEYLAGGNEYPMPGGTVRAANITPHETGIGSWTEDQFVHRFKTYADSTYIPHTIHDGEFQTLMPWLMYKDMSTDDLKAIYQYLRTIPPVENNVLLFTSNGSSH